MATFKEALEYERRLHSVRSGILGLFAQVDDLVDRALAGGHARDVQSFWSLYLDVFPKVQVPVRVELFKRLADTTPAPPGGGHGSAHTFVEAHPLMLPLLDELVRARNVLAHAIIDRTTQGAEITLRQRRKGAIQAITFDLNHLEGLVKQEWPLINSLDEIFPLAAGVELWGALNGFDEGLGEAP